MRDTSAALTSYRLAQVIIQDSLRIREDILLLEYLSLPMDISPHQM